MKNLIVALVFTISTTVFAATGVVTGGTSSESKTTDMFAPNVGNSELLVGILIPTGTIEVPGSKFTISGMALTASFGHSFSEYITVYGLQGYSNFSYSSEPTGNDQKFIGVGDTKVGVKAILNNGNAFFYYDAGYTAALLAKSKSKVTATESESTAVSSRPSLNLKGGVGAAFDMVGVGGLITINLFQDSDDQTETAGVTTTSKNKSGTGLDWKLYAQYQAGIKVGFSYGESKIEEYDRVSASGTTSINPKNESKTMSVYTIVPVAAGSELHFEILKPEAKDSTLTYNLLFVSAAYRATF